MKNIFRVILYLVIFTIFTLTITSTSAYAHGIGSESGSDSSSRVTVINPATTDFKAKSVQNGQLIKITRTSSKEIIVLGVENEPYLKLSKEGVFENTKSGTLLINKSTNNNIDTSTLNKEFENIDSDPNATPNWKKISSNSSYSFHDHRIHYMGSVPDNKTDLGANSIDLLVDQQKYIVIVSFSTTDKPNYIIYLSVFILLILLIIAAFKINKISILSSTKQSLLISLFILLLLESIHIAGYINFVESSLSKALIQSLYGLIMILLILICLLRLVFDKNDSYIYKNAPLLVLIGVFGFLINTIGEYKTFTLRYVPSTLPASYSRIALIIIGVTSIFLIIVGTKNFHNQEQ